MEKQFKVKAPEGNFADFTSGKIYKIYNVNHLSFNTISDSGCEAYCLWKECYHIDNKNWIKVNPK